MKITLALITAGLTLGSNPPQATAGQLGNDLIMGDGNVDVFLGATDGQNLSTGIHASYDERSRVLSIAGSERNDFIKISAGRDGVIVVNDGLVRIEGGSPSVEKVYDVAVFGAAGDDVLISEIGRIVMYGDEGDDILVWDNGETQFYGSYYQGDLLIYNDQEEEAPLGGYYSRDLVLEKVDDGSEESQDGPACGLGTLTVTATTISGNSPN